MSERKRWKHSRWLPGHDRNKRIVWFGSRWFHQRLSFENDAYGYTLLTYTGGLGQRPVQAMVSSVVEDCYWRESMAAAIRACRREARRQRTQGQSDAAQRVPTRRVHALASAATEGRAA